MNHARIDDGEVQTAIRAVNRQIAQDFAPHWGLSATLRLERTGRGGSLQAMRGDAIIYLHDHTKGFHFETAADIPYAVVFTRLNDAAGPQGHPSLFWPVILSHETLELLADPYNNLLVKGPHPVDRQREVFHYREICDPVQMESYQIDGVSVSNFVLPRYYNAGGAILGKNDFLGSSLKAFRWNQYGYIGFWDPRIGRYGHYEMFPQYRPHDLPAKVRRLKGKLGRLAKYAKPNVRRRSR